jgi:iron complex transport system substrate-binding protein
MRIISLQPSVSIILDRLGCLESLVACTRYCIDAVPGLRGRSIPIVHDSWSAKSEELASIGADLVIASVPYRQEALAAILKSGCRVMALAPRKLEDIYDDIRLIAAVVHASERGDALVEEMRASIGRISHRSESTMTKPLVYCEEWGKPLIYSQFWVKELVEASGGIFLGSPGTVTDAQSVAAADPDVIVVAWCGAGDRVPLEKLVVQREWQGLRAVKNNRVFCIADELLNTPAPTLIGGLDALAQSIHPALFGAIGAKSGRQIKPFSS